MRRVFEMTTTARSLLTAIVLGSWQLVLLTGYTYGQRLLALDIHPMIKTLGTRLMLHQCRFRQPKAVTASLRLGEVLGRSVSGVFMIPKISDFNRSSLAP